MKNKTEYLLFKVSEIVEDYLLSGKKNKKVAQNSYQSFFVVTPVSDFPQSCHDKLNYIHGKVSKAREPVSDWDVLRSPVERAFEEMGSRALYKIKKDTWEIYKILLEETRNAQNK